MSKKGLGFWLAISGILLLVSGIFFLGLCNIFFFSNNLLICDKSISLFLIILGIAYIIIGGLIWSKKDKPS